MENFDALRSNNSNDVMKYMNDVMTRLSRIENESSLKDRQLYNYDLEVKRLQQENLNLKNQINYYKQIEATLNNSMNMIKNTGEQIRNNALKEREVIISDAKNNASRILNDALIRAEKVNFEADKLKKDVVIYKNKVRSLIECQLEVIDDIDKVDI